MTQQDGQVATSPEGVEGAEVQQRNKEIQYSQEELTVCLLAYLAPCKAESIHSSCAVAFAYFKLIKRAREA